MNKISKFLKWCGEDCPKQLNRKIQLKKKRKHQIMNFVLIADEADDYDPTDERATLLQEAYKKVKALGPRLMINVTATPYSLFKNFEQHNVPHEVLAIKQDLNQYCALLDLVPFQVNGKPLFLEEDEVKVGKGIVFDGTHIPSTCKKSLLMYEQAVLGHSVGVLLVDISNHLVYVEDSIVQKAKLGK